MRAKKYIHDVGSHPERLKAALLGVLILLIGGGVFWWQNRPPQEEASPSESAVQQRTEPEESTVTELKGKYLFSGTVVPARAVENEARRADGTVDYAQPFSKLDTFNPEQYDGWLIDFECPMTTDDIPYRTQVQNTVFNCPDEFAPEMAEYFTHANVANNHTRDQGDDGFTETVEHLEQAEIQTIGHWDPRETDEICEVVELGVRLQKSAGAEEKGTLPIAMCTWHYFEKDATDEELAVMDEYADIMPVFAFMQVGTEYRAGPDQKQIDLAHRLVDNHDPEFLIQNSAHWVQNTESYKGKLVVYSTGNFIFDQLDDETNRGLNIEAEMTVPYDQNVQEWLDLGKTCKPRGDNCLRIARELGLEKVDISLSYDAIGSSTGYQRLTQKAAPDLQAAIEQRADWEETINGLSN
ncbi:MAG: CapA family protein [Candidatus Saccharibacteria bacterium]|nr:CapA family protein [Candidatus Saccharibacteria bacterium]